LLPKYRRASAVAMALSAISVLNKTGVQLIMELAPEFGRLS
jgi:hypothetical protein